MCHILLGFTNLPIPAWWTIGPKHVHNHIRSHGPENPLKPHHNNQPFKKANIKMSQKQDMGFNHDSCHDSWKSIGIGLYLYRFNIYQPIGCFTSTNWLNMTFAMTDLPVLQLGSVDSLHGTHGRGEPRLVAALGQQMESCSLGLVSTMMMFGLKKLNHGIENHRIELGFLGCFFPGVFKQIQDNPRYTIYI